MIKTIETNYLNYLRVLSCFAVILLHYSGSYKYRIEIDTFDIGVQFFTVSRWCVPVFLMISGALLLGKKTEIVHFYRRRFLRIVPPFLFWSLIYLTYRYYEVGNIGGNIFNIIFVKGAQFHFWYVFLIIGIIMFLPFLTDWTSRKDKKSLLIFLLIWLYWLITVNKYDSFATGVNLMYFSGYIGYLILGYYLYLLPKDKLYLYLGIVFFIIGVVYSYYKTMEVSLDSGRFVESHQRYLSWNVLLMSIGVFQMVKYLSIPKYFQVVINELAKYSFGIYLAHIIVRDLIVEQYFQFLNFEDYSFLIIKSIIVMLLSYIFVKIFYKAPLVGKYISG